MKVPIAELEIPATVTLADFASFSNLTSIRAAVGANFFSESTSVDSSYLMACCDTASENLNASVVVASGQTSMSSH